MRRYELWVWVEDMEELMILRSPVLEENVVKAESLAAEVGRSIIKMELRPYGACDQERGPR